MLNLSKTDTRRFPLAAILLADESSSFDVDVVANLLATQRCGQAKAHAIETTYSSYHPAAWEF